MAGIAAWRRCPRVHATFFLICFTFMLYGNISDPIARSLVECTEPVAAAAGSNFTGSSRCGDRLLVIEHGQAFAASAKAARLTVSTTSAVALGAVADVHGRKAFMMVYLAAVLASMLCMSCLDLLAFDVAWAGYVGSAALAGVFTIDQNGYKLILGDLAEGDKSSLGGLYQFQTFVQAASSALGLGGSLFITSLHLSSYRPICLSLAGLVVACMLLTASLEETRPRGGKTASDEEEATTLAALKEAVQLVRGSAYMRCRLPVVLCQGVVESFPAVLAPFTMAVYGWPQEVAGKLVILFCPLYMVSLALSMRISRSVGERRVVLCCLWSGAVGLPLFLMLMPLSPAFLHIAHVILIVNSTVPRPLLGAVDTNLQDEAARARFSSLLSVCKSCVVIAMQPLLTWLFDATAKDYVTRVRPLAVLAVFMCASNCLQLLPPLGPMLGRALDDLTADRLAKAAAEESKKAS